jgi:hypothetical protein
MDEQPDRTVEARGLEGGATGEREPGAERRTWFLMRETELGWLPVSEAAFLLWVLALLLLAWLVTALVWVVN